MKKVFLIFLVPLQNIIKDNFESNFQIMKAKLLSRNK